MDPIQQPVPTGVKQAVKQFYAATALYSLFFATGNWLFFWRLFLTNGRIGVVDSLCFLVGMLAEVPTGAIADKIGRRRTMVIGVLLMGAGYSTMGFAVNGVMILLGFALFTVGSSFYSGADDALMYDYLKSQNQEEEWKKIARRKQIVTRIGSVLAIFAGGYMYILNIRLPHIIRGILFFFMLYPLAKMKYMDSAQPSTLREAGVGYFKHIWIGMKGLLNRNMLPTVILVFAIQGVTVTMFISGILRPLLIERTGLPIADHSTYIAIVGIVAILALLWNGRNKAKITSLSRQAILWSIVVAVGFALNIPTHSLTGGLLGIALIHIGSYMLVPTTSTIINKSALSHYRATVLSTSNLLEDLPYIFAAPLIGLAADKHQLTLVIEMIFFIMIIAIGFSATLYSRMQAEE